jgi:hypothetical protein
MSSRDEQFASALESIRHALAQDKNGQPVVDLLHDRFDHYSWVGVYGGGGELVLATAL